MATKALRQNLIQQAVYFFQFPQLSDGAEAAKLFWLVRLRWAAIALFFLMTGPAYLWGAINSNTMPVFVGIVGILFVFNLLTHLVFTQSKKAIGPLLICFQLAFDLLVLASLLLISGGFANPFITLFLLNMALGGVLIQGRYAWPFVILGHLLLAALQLSFFNEHRLENLNGVSAFVFASHVLVFSVWLVMRSLGLYLENHFQKVVQARIQFEKQDRLRAIGALAAGFSHEFASPLNAAKLRLDRLERKLVNYSLPDDLIENLTEARLSISSCEAVIHHMNSSQLDVRSYDLKPVPVKEFLNDVITSWQETHVPAQISIQIKQHLNLRVSPINFAQVILNLLDNAYHANSKGIIEINFHIENNQIIFSVADDGPGFDAAVLSRQGEPFVTTKENGTGLGLYVSEIFAQSLGGLMHLENRPSGGAKVILHWPLEGNTV